MRRIFLIPGLFTIGLIIGCRQSDNQGYNLAHIYFDQAELNGRLANEGFNRCLSYTNPWLNLADRETGLIPRNIIDRQSKDIWNAKDCGADNFPYMALSCALLDRELFNGTMMDMLKTKTRLTSRIGSLPDTYSFSRHDI